jgi:hypothetical protein
LYHEYVCKVVKRASYETKNALLSEFLYTSLMTSSSDDGQLIEQKVGSVLDYILSQDKFRWSYFHILALLASIYFHFHCRYDAYGLLTVCLSFGFNRGIVSFCSRNISSFSSYSEFQMMEQTLITSIYLHLSRLLVCFSVCGGERNDDKLLGALASSVRCILFLNLASISLEAYMQEIHNVNQSLGYESTQRSGESDLYTVQECDKLGQLLESMILRCTLVIADTHIGITY